MTQHPPRTSSLPVAKDRVEGQQLHDVSSTSASTSVSATLATGSDISRPTSTAPLKQQPDITTKPGPDVLSDKATAAFIRRTLCAQHALAGTALGGDRGERNTPRPVDELLPPLTSSNEVDLQLYAILAVILKEFVYAWYAKITPDHVFVDEVIHIIAHCTRALEQRLRKADLEAILLDEIPQLVDAHVTSFRIAHDSAYQQPLAHSPRDVYHTLVPHPALEPVPRESVPSTLLEQARNEESWRQLLVQGVLAVLLPTEDLENDCLRALVAEIFSDLILANGVAGKACEPWLLWDGITTAIEAAQPSTLKAVEKPTVAASRLEQFGLLSQARLARDGEKQNQRGNLVRPGSAASRSISGILLAIVSFVFWAFTAARTLMYTVTTPSSLPSRSKTWLSTQSPTQADEVDAASNSILSDDQRPILSMSVWTMAGRVLDLDLRMPWLSGLFSLSHHIAMYGPGRLGDTDGALDRWLSSKVHEHLLNPAHIPRLLKIVRATLFPNNAPGPPKRAPDATEIIAIRRRCAETIVSAAPDAVLFRYFDVNKADHEGDGGAREKLIYEVEEMLGVLGDAYLNKHLMYNLIELLIVRLLPELGEKAVRELMKERIGEDKDR